MKKRKNLPLPGSLIYSRLHLRSCIYILDLKVNGSRRVLNRITKIMIDLDWPPIQIPRSEFKFHE
jgi:hypothetical protein